MTLHDQLQKARREIGRGNYCIRASDLKEQAVDVDAFLGRMEKRNAELVIGYLIDKADLDDPNNPL